MRKIYIFIIIICCLLTANSCSYDNFDEPKSMLTGKAIYNGEPVSVRSGSSEFALFQDGYALHGSIPVYIAQRRKLLSEPIQTEIINLYALVMHLGKGHPMIRFGLQLKGIPYKISQ